MRCRPLILAALLAACGDGEPFDPPTRSPAPDLFRGIAIERTDDARFPVVAAHEDGSMVAPVVEDGDLAGAIYVDFDELGRQRHFLVELDDEGRPLRAETGKRVFAFLNYTDNTADVLALGQATHRAYQGNHAVDAELFARLRSIHARLRPIGAGADPGELYRFAAHAVRAAACVSGVISSNHPAIPVPEGIVYPCTSPVTTVGSGEDAIGRTDGVVSLRLRFAPCKSGDGAGCVGAVLERFRAGVRRAHARLADARDSEDQLRQDFTSQRLAGFWRIRLTLTLAEGPAATGCSIDALEEARVLDAEVEHGPETIVFRTQLVPDEVLPGLESLMGMLDLEAGSFTVASVFFQGDATAEQRYRLTGTFPNLSRLEGTAEIAFPVGERGTTCRTTWGVRGNRLAPNPATG